MAISYLWVYTIDGANLKQAVASFPESAPRLGRIARRWTIRRAFVREAERRCFARGERFRARIYPLYAKDVAQQIREQRREACAPRRPLYERRKQAPQSRTFRKMGKLFRQASRHIDVKSRASQADHELAHNGAPAADSGASGSGRLGLGRRSVRSPSTREPQRRERRSSIGGAIRLLESSADLIDGKHSKVFNQGHDYRFIDTSVI